MDHTCVEVRGVRQLEDDLVVADARCVPLEHRSRVPSQVVTAVHPDTLTVERREDGGRVRGYPVSPLVGDEHLRTVGPATILAAPEFHPIIAARWTQKDERDARAALISPGVHVPEILLHCKGDIEVEGRAGLVSVEDVQRSSDLLVDAPCSSAARPVVDAVRGVPVGIILRPVVEILLVDRYPRVTLPVGAPHREFRRLDGCVGVHSGVRKVEPDHGVHLAVIRIVGESDPHAGVVIASRVVRHPRAHPGVIDRAAAQVQRVAIVRLVR